MGAAQGGAGHGRFRLRRRVGVGGTAGVEHQHRHVGIHQQLAQFRAIDILAVFVLAGVLEEQVAMFAGPLPAEQQRAEPPPEAAAAFRGVQVSAVAVEVDDVVGTAVVFGLVQRLA